MRPNAANTHITVCAAARPSPPMALIRAQASPMKSSAVRTKSIQKARLTPRHMMSPVIGWIRPKCSNRKDETLILPPVSSTKAMTGKTAKNSSAFSRFIGALGTSSGTSRIAPMANTILTRQRWSHG